jgi:hypothetical protein
MGIPTKNTVSRAQSHVPRADQREHPSVHPGLYAYPFVSATVPRYRYAMRLNNLNVDLAPPVAGRSREDLLADSAE